jgi:hypothetical protein
LSLGHNAYHLVNTFVGALHSHFLHETLDKLEIELEKIWVINLVRVYLGLIFLHLLDEIFVRQDIIVECGLLYLALHLLWMVVCSSGTSIRGLHVGPCC